MESLHKLSTAQTYVEHYYSQLKKELNARGLQVSKVGVIGLLLHILGFTQQDIKQYFDTLFREAFLGTADRYENLIMHGSIFGYFPKLSSPSSIVGDFELNFKVLPTASNDTKRILVIEDLVIEVNEIPFKLDSRYIIQDNICQITDSNGQVTNIPFSLSNPKVPIIDFIQYEETEMSFTCPFYVFGAYYPKILDFGNNESSKITDLKVYVQISENDEFIEFEPRLVDYHTGPEENVVFVQYLPDNQIYLELGSGIHGKYIPNSKIRVKARTTLGSKGNISQQVAIPNEGVARLYDNRSDGSGSSYTLPVTNLVTANITYADGGTDILDGQDLREAIINFVRSRDNLLSELDFYDLLKEYLDDFILMFKKTHVVENVIYCFIPFRDEYQIPLKAMSISVSHSEFNPSGDCYIYRPTFTVNGVEYISPFLYEVDYLMRFYKGYVVWEKISRYFSNVINIQESSDNVVKSIPLTLFAQYNPVNDNTRFIIQSYQNIRDYVFFISIPKLDIHDICMNPITDTLIEYYYFDNYNDVGLIFETVDIIIKVYSNGDHLFTYNMHDFSMVHDITDFLTLKTYDGIVSTDGSEEEDLTDDILNLNVMFSDDTIVLNIPVMRIDVFNEKENYYIQKMVDTFGILANKKNRMISDDVQIRFTNTDYMTSDNVKILTKQNHDHDLNMPLQLQIDIVAYKEQVLTLGLDTLNVEYDLKVELAQKLHDTYTGHQISFYRTQIVDIIHNLEWVKYCDVKVYDNNSRQITDANFEMINQADVIAKQTKEEAVKYCPLYVWWDLDNIVINLSFE